MNDNTIIKTLLAALVVEKVISKTKAENVLYRIEKNFIRGVALPLDLTSLIAILGDK